MKRYTKEELVEMSPEEFDRVTRAYPIQGDCVHFRLLAIADPEVERQTRAFVRRLRLKKKLEKGRMKSQVERPRQPQRQSRKHAPK